MILPYRLKKALPILSLVFLFSALTATVYLVQKNTSNKSKALAPSSNIYQPKRFLKKSNGIKKVVWEEKKIEKAVVNQPLDVKITRSKSNDSDPLPITGNWEGKTVKVVPNDRFSQPFKDHSGVHGIQVMPDNRIFFGTYDHFGIKEANDTNWEHIEYYDLNLEFPTSINFFTPTRNTSPYEIYFGDNYTSGGKIVLMKTDGSIELVADPTDTYGYLRNVKVIPYYKDTVGAVAYRSWALAAELYYLEEGSLRKWFAPTHSCGGSYTSDQILAMVTNPGDDQKTYGIIKEVVYSPWPYCAVSYNYFLYQYIFSSNPEVPLEIYKLGQITGETMDEFNYVFISYQLNQPDQKILYGLVDNNSDYFYVVPYFYDDGQNMTISKFDFDPEIYTASKDSTVELKPNQLTDNLWFVVSEVNGIYLARGFDGSLPGYVVKTGDNPPFLASPWMNAVTNDEMNNVYTGHQYTPGQFNDAMVTILEGPVNTPTPTPTPTSLPTPTPTLSPNPYFGNSASIHYPEPQGYATIPYKPNLSLSTVFTIEGWINPGNSSSDMVLLSQNITTGGPNNSPPYTVYYLSYNNKLGIQLLDSSGNWSYFETQAEVLPQLWHHFAFVKDHETMKIFIDGNLDSSNTVSENIAINTDYLTLAALKANEVVLFGYDGLMEELRISDNARYSADFTLQSLPFTSDADTLLLYHFDENNGATTIEDSSDENNDGAIVGQIEFIPSTVTAPAPPITPSPTPTPVPTFIPTLGLPAPTCVPRPACLDAKPPCRLMIPRPAGGWCKATPTPALRLKP